MPQIDSELAKGPSSTNWWSAECGVAELLKLALPLVISTASFTVMHFCDRMFLTWHSTDAMAAVMPAGMMNWATLCFPLGVAAYATTFVAQYVGAGQDRNVGLVIWQAIWIGVLSLPVFALMAYFAPTIFTSFKHTEPLLSLEVTYFQIVCIGSGGGVLSAALNAFFVGRGKMMVVMVVNICAALLNILLDLWFVFDGLGVAAMGIKGAALATVVSMWFKVVVYTFLFLKPVNVERYGVKTGFRFDRSIFLRLIRFGGPNGFQFLIEAMALTCFTLVIAQIGKVEAAATTLAFSVNMLAFVPVLGIGMAATTMVGQQIGKQRPEMARRATWSALKLALAYTLCFSIAYLTLPRLFLSGHAAVAANNPEYQEIETLAVFLLQFVAAYCLMDALQLTFVSTLKGEGDTLFVLIITVCTSIAFLIGGYVGATFFEETAEQMIWWWTMITVWIWCLAGIYFVRFQQGKWESMTVIEPELVADG